MNPRGINPVIMIKIVDDANSSERVDFMLRFLRIAVIFLVITSCSLAQAAEYTYKQGDKGVEVLNIQKKLQEIGYFHGKPDGVFSAKTTEAVEWFQKARRLKVTGMVDPRTHRALFAAKKKAPDRKAKILGASAVEAVPKKGPVTDRNVSPKQDVSRSTGSLIQTAKQYIGVPYKFGGVTPRGFDCSGYVQFVFAKHGAQLPRTADIQYKTGKAIQRRQLVPGDLVFFTTYAPGASHNGIYIGKEQFIHASSSKGVMISRLDESYWKPRYLGARRVV